MTFFPSASRAADCAVQKNLDAISDAMMACESVIGEAAAELESPDAVVKQKAARRIADAVKVLDAQEQFLKTQPADKTVTNNQLQIADIRDIHNDGISRAQTVSSTPNPDPKSGDQGSKPADDKAAAGGAGGSPAGGGPPGGGGAKDPGGKPGVGTAAVGGAGGSSAGGGGGGAGGSAGGGPPGGGGGGLNFSEKGAGALSRAKAAAAGFKTAEDDGLAGPASQAGPGSPAAAGGPARAEGGSPADLGALAASGFSSSFKAAGLKMGPGGQLQREDGSAASPADIARLREQISRDPQALIRRPDFFDVLDRPGFERLKSDFAAKPEEKDQAFKDIDLKDQRDFDFTKSCSPALDKSCNAHVKKAYRKGDYVSPEDLKAIDEALNPPGGQTRQAQAAAESAQPAGQASETQTPPRERLRSFASRLKALFARSKGRRAAAHGGSRGAVAPGSAAEQESVPEEGSPLHWWQAAVLAGLAAAWAYASRRKKAFLERD